MDPLSWVAENWFNLLSSVGIVGSLLFTGIALHSDNKSQRIANLLTLTSNHREIWREFYRRPELRRVLDVSSDLAVHPVTPAEEEFVKFVILHLSSAFYAMEDELLMNMQGMRKDVRAFLLLPVPYAVWERVKNFQNEDFVVFVEDCLKSNFPGVQDSKSK